VAVANCVDPVVVERKTNQPHEGGGSMCGRTQKVTRPAEGEGER